MGAANGHLTKDEVVVVVRESLFRYWRKMGYCIADAEDIAQEGVKGALESANTWRKEAKLGTFLTKVGKNRGIDYLRKQGTQKKLKDAVKLENSISYRRTPKAK